MTLVKKGACVKRYACAVVLVKRGELIPQVRTRSNVVTLWEERQINFRQLTYFRKVVELGNMTAAAETLNVAQPALGSQIKQLEGELGIELLVRHSRGITPTPAGRLLYTHAQHILDDVATAANEVRALTAAKRIELRLGVGRTMSKLLGQDLLADANQTMPDVTIHVIEERPPDLLHALEEGQVDVAFLNNVGEWSGLKRKAVLEEDLLFVTASSQAAQEESIEFTEALQYDLAIGGERGVLRHIVESEARRLSLDIRIAHEVHSIDSIASGTAAMIMPYGLIAKEVREGTLAARRIIKPALTRTLYMVRRHSEVPVLDDQRVIHHLQRLMDVYLSLVKPWARLLS
ncbi:MULTISPECIES: LysR family transcriptional regulator [unclassified Sinorhizobium]|uniref:LysR family transcriptional regulator n=1 Tax=unclassified Sinorhizobium TaxID=2613772 RepID=UPI0024C22510|nr:MULTISPECIES: LysR family transcriptional regulator [unclassified Sinorhizobium]MDK1373957.1 LysR family transcriptional regulator [Sinorhizobium sp. 6-70]MDK1477370.1 LysR family transcriptional regulator [Sinorhizobium sp. 6-117]